MILVALQEKQNIAMKIFTQERRTHTLKDSIMKIKQTSQRVMRRMEYLHRKESHQVDLQLREVDRKQHCVTHTMEEQRKILIAFQQEQKTLSLVSENQKILQMLQLLFTRFPSDAKLGIVSKVAE
jgi:hypothetical protein